MKEYMLDVIGHDGHRAVREGPFIQPHAAARHTYWTSVVGYTVKMYELVEVEW